MYIEIGHRPTQHEASMHIGTFVQKKDSKGTLGFITERPPITGCWSVLWTQGKNRGSVLISQEAELEIAGVQTKV
jgi:hypothetical protein|tara:strand:- start:303 stop:527 length:225 start_codon:yes stop_codon:yes gene_type:complete